MSAETQPQLSLGQIAGYFARLGTIGFGGPIALAGYMQRDLVERRHWFTQEEYLQGLAASQTLRVYLCRRRAGKSHRCDTKRPVQALMPPSRPPILRAKCRPGRIAA